MPSMGGEVVGNVNLAETLSEANCAEPLSYVYHRMHVLLTAVICILQKATMKNQRQMILLYIPDVERIRTLRQLL